MLDDSEPFLIQVIEAHASLARHKTRTSLTGLGQDTWENKF